MHGQHRLPMLLTTLFPLKEILMFVSLITSASNESNWATTDLNIATPRWQLHVPGVRMMGAWTTNAFFAVKQHLEMKKVTVLFKVK